MKTIGIVGLGLIGGSFARAYKAADAEFTVYAADKDASTLAFARLMGAIDGELTRETLQACDCVLVCLHTALSCAWLEENAPGASELSDAAGQGGNGNGNSPGSGGISRGRGDALLYFTGETQDVGDERRDLVLDNNTPGQSVSILEFATSPGEETAERAKAGQLSGTGQPAEHAETRILPSHRESVRRYFNNSPDQP